MFLVILPLSVSDSHLVDGWVTVFRALKGAPACHLVFVPTPLMRTKARYAAAAVQGYCASAEVHALESEPKGEFPKASNDHFKGAMFIRQKLGARANLPFIWMEMDALPLVEDWAGKLYQAYVMEANNSGFMGTLTPMVRDIKKVPNDTPQKDLAKVLASTKGTLVTTDDDLYMEGVGIYPANFDRAVDKQYIHTKGAPFDQKLRPYMKRNWHNTELIQSRWRTRNYAIDPESGEVLGEDSPDNPHGTIHAGPVHETTVLFHGCKDTSLQKILAKSRGVEIRPVEEMAERPLTAVAQPKKIEIPASRKVATKKVSGFKPFGTPAVENKPKPSAMLMVPTGEPVTVETLVAKVSSEEKPRSLKQWAAAFGVSQPELEQVVNSPESGLHLVGLGKFVRMKAA